MTHIFPMTIHTYNEYRDLAHLHLIKGRMAYLHGLSSYYYGTTDFGTMDIRCWYLLSEEREAYLRGFRGEAPVIEFNHV